MYNHLPIGSLAVESHFFSNNNKTQYRYLPEIYGQASGRSQDQYVEYISG